MIIWWGCSEVGMRGKKNKRELSVSMRESKGKRSSGRACFCYTGSSLDLNNDVHNLFLQVTELECQSNQTPVIKSQKTELNQTIEELETALRDKEEVCVCVIFP